MAVLHFAYHSICRGVSEEELTTANRHMPKRKQRLYIYERSQLPSSISLIPHQATGENTTNRRSLLLQVRLALGSIHTGSPNHMRRLFC